MGSCFGLMVYRPPWKEISRTPMVDSMFICWLLVSQQTVYFIQDISFYIVKFISRQALDNNFRRVKFDKEV